VFLQIIIAKNSQALIRKHMFYCSLEKYKYIVGHENENSFCFNMSYCFSSVSAKIWILLLNVVSVYYET
jgi:hypothetical protein